MASKIPIRQQLFANVEPIKITDLDQFEPDTDIKETVNKNENLKSRKLSEMIETQRTSQHCHRKKYRNDDLKTYSGNFHGIRSKSSSHERGMTHKKIVGEGHRTTGDDTKKVDVNYFKVMLQTKDDQIEKLIQKITDLQLYNTQFSQDNERLQNENYQLKNSLKDLNIKFEEIQNRECQKCKNLIIENNNLIETNKEQTEDILMLKTLVHRLNVQLERYQDKIREITSINQKNEQNNQNIPHISTLPQRISSTSPLSDIPQDWGDVNTHTLSPLLTAYEEIIKEKNYLLEQHELELNRFTGQFKKIIIENNEIHQKIDDLRQLDDKWRDEKTRMQAQLDVFRNKAEIQTKRADLAKEKLSEIVRCYEHKVQSQSLDIERLQEAYSKAKGELITLKNVQQQKPGDIVSENLKECQKLFEELKIQYNNERKNLSDELTEIKKCNLELKNQFTELQNENKILNQNYEEFKQKNTLLKQALRKLKESRDRLKSRLRNTLLWVRKLEEGREKVRNTWNDIRELESIIRHKEAQIKGLHARYTIEIEKLQEKLQQKDQTIKKLIREKIDEVK